jgi:hypothetical protein
MVTEHSVTFLFGVGCPLYVLRVEFWMFVARLLTVGPHGGNQDQGFSSAGPRSATLIGHLAGMADAQVSAWIAFSLRNQPHRRDQGTREGAVCAFTARPRRNAFAKQATLRRAGAECQDSLPAKSRCSDGRLGRLRGIEQAGIRSLAGQLV